MGQEKKYEVVKFTPIKEDWNRYKLEDGNIIEIKLIALRVIKYSDEIDEFGTPHYVVRSHNVVNAIVPTKKG